MTFAVRFQQSNDTKSSLKMTLLHDRVVYAQPYVLCVCVCVTVSFRPD